MTSKALRLDPKRKTRISADHLLLFALLHCQDGNKRKQTNKAKIFYEIVQSGLPEIGNDDGDFPPTIGKMLSLVTEDVFLMAREDVSASYTEDEKQQLRDTYEEIQDDFVDSVFKNRTRLNKDEFIENLAG